MEPETGVLYVVATPIGNLADVTERARKLLSEVDLIAAEDTRQTRRLLASFGISGKLAAYHDHNEDAMSSRLLDELEAGRDVALVSDAGTPLISDPGYRIVSRARQRGIRVTPVPGASAVICALSAAGLPSDRFLFLGFPPRTAAPRRALLESVSAEPGTLVFYESGKRILPLLQDVEISLGARSVVLARELTKRFETFLLGTPSELAERVAADESQRLGEMVVLIEGSSGPDEERQQAEQVRVLRILCEAMPLSQAAALGARLTGGKKNALYRLGIELGLAD